MSKVLLAGSYDPITNGHAALVRKCAALFDEVYAVVFINAEKTCLFSLEQRKEMLRLAFAGLDNVTVDAYEGMTVDYARKNGINILVRGVRGASDVEYEMIMANNNRRYAPEITTLFLPADEELSGLSSGAVREKLKRGESIRDYVPAPVCEYIERKTNSGI